MSDTAPDSTLMIELDAMLDTRMATLYEYYGGDAVLKVLKQGYHDRWFDKFPDIDYEDFKLKYAQRDKRVLKHAVRTPILKIVQEFVLNTLQNAQNTPFVYFPKIAINTYPYVLTAEENRTIRDSIVVLTNDRCDVELISLSMAELTPAYFQEHFAIVVMYDYDQWLETHSEQFKKMSCPDVGMIVPMMFKKYPLTDQDRTIIRDLEQDAKMTPFDYLVKVTAPIIRLAFMPVSEFSMVLKPDMNDVSN